ncbi:MAG: SEL1-like repeat protein [Alphaproteobacteria bacterium]|nr:SEL1-like repeat protein [Alphaproteobacteria bacterium]
MRNVPQNKNNLNKNAAVRLKAANYQADGDRPFNRLLEEREERERRELARDMRTRKVKTVSPANGAPRRQASKSGTQQIMDLLKEFNVRLKRDELERERLWKEMESLQVTIDHQKSRAVTQPNNIDKWKRVMEDNQKALHSQIENTRKLHSDMQERMETVETTSGSVALRFDDVLTEQRRLSRRVDTAVEDKTRLLKKMENLEDALTQTQDTLRAKALVLLTDQATASKTNLRQVPAYEESYTPKFEQAPRKKEDPIFVHGNNGTKREESFMQHPAKMNAQSTSRWGYYATAASVIGILAVAGVLVLQQNTQDTGSYDFVTSNSQKIATVAPTFENIDMAALAPSMNAIEPGRNSDAPVLTSVQDFETNEVKRTTLPATGLKKEIVRAEQRSVALLVNSVPRGDLMSVIGVDASLPEMVKAIEVEALQDNAAAQHDLAAIYTAGHGGVKANMTKAAQWFEQASFNGVANARYNLGVLYHQGLGVEKNESYAIDLYRTAAHLDHPEAQYNLGIAYIEGVGVPQNVGYAAHYFEEAATNNVMEAAYNLGLIYENGLLGVQQPDEALFWYKVSSSKGSLEGRQALESLADKLELNPSDIDALISRISLLKPKVNLVLGIRSQKEAATALTQAVDVAPVPVSVKTVYTETPSFELDMMATNITPGSDAVIVAQIQEQLINLGMYPGPADGIVGPVTQDAVRSYQSSNGISSDGVASEDLLVHMLAREFELNTYPSSGLFEDVGSQE